MSLPLNHRNYPPRHPANAERGVVIVLALFIVALVAAMSYAMMWRLSRDTRQTMLILRDTQAEFYAQGAIAWSMDQLRNDWIRQKPDQPIDVFPMKAPVKEMNGYRIESTLTDMQARFNLNTLTDPKAQIDFQRLIQLLNPSLRPEEAAQIVKAVVDWITPGAQETEFTKYYLGLPAPYRAAHRPMQTVSELRLVKGVTGPLYESLKPYVAALPTTTLINIQTADAYVLASLSLSIPLEVANTIVQLRSQLPLTTIQAFANMDIVKNHGFPVEKVTMTSQYFLVETTVTIENQRVLLYTLLERSTAGSKPTITVLWQGKGSW